MSHPRKGTLKMERKPIEEEEEGQFLALALTVV